MKGSTNAGQWYAGIRMIFSPSRLSASPAIAMAPRPFLVNIQCSVYALSWFFKVRKRSRDLGLASIVGVGKLVALSSATGNLTDISHPYEISGNSLNLHTILATIILITKHLYVDIIFVAFR